MPKTVDQGALAENRSKEREVFGLANRLRDVANQQYTERFTLTTAATGVLTAIWTSPEVPEKAVWRVQAAVVGRATAGGAAVLTCDIYGLFYRESGGSVTQEGIVYSASAPLATVAGTDCDIVISGNTVVVKVQDEGTRTFSWTARVTVLEGA